MTKETNVNNKAHGIEIQISANFKKYMKILNINGREFEKFAQCVDILQVART